MYILIAGDSEVGFQIAELLMAQNEVILIGPDPSSVPRLDRLDVHFAPGDPTSAEVLQEAGARRCDIFVAATENDEKNLVACVAAQRMGAGRTICLLTRPGFVSIEEHEDALAASLGIDAIVRPADQLAREILRIVTVPGALDVEHFIHGRVRLLRHNIEEGSRLVGKPLHQASLPENVVLVMCRRGEQTFIPRGDTVFEVGDKVTAMGTLRGVDDMLYGFFRPPAAGRAIREATIVGGGVVGTAVAIGLEARGWRVKVIEFDPTRCEEIAPKIKGLVLRGDGSDLDLLQEERIGDAPVLVAVTSNDEKNLLVSLLARHLGVSRIVTRADRLSNERMFEQVGIDVVRSARGAAIRKVVRDVVSAESHIHAELEHGDIHVIELELPPEYPPVSLMDLRSSLFAVVASIVRGREVIIPTGRDKIQGGDRLLVFTALEDEEAVRKLLLTIPAEESRTGPDNPPETGSDPGAGA